MIKVLKEKEAVEFSQKLRKEKKTVVVCGGCFDILHVGHIKFLKSAKKQGDFLFVLLESDWNVKKIKGDKRPINSQIDRAEILSSLSFVDYVVLLSEMKTDNDYDLLVTNLKPNVIAITSNSSSEKHVKRQAQKLGAKVIPVIEKVEDKSTSRLARIIFENFRE